ncbi:unnamed protein product [Adineta steineri]|uniref:Ubiquitin-specific peptidase-like SUMO isopeptidase domain-containing protein n=1 Tax=Adineta steineri TaxID=433720 RepID=A0A814XSW8_9BILA|nr:unnamed protein product [Adineta steineri]CAF3927587.1 unnamed protein product [Adineta steineri]
MTSVPSETIWSSMIAARQLSLNYYTLSTCLTDLLHRYIEISSSSQNNNVSSSLFHNLDRTLFSTTTNPSKLSDEYSNIIHNILKQNSLHTNIIQNVRRLFRFDSFLKELFTTEVNEHCQCQECDCTISNSITDVIHDIKEIRTTLLTEPSQTSCACFRCGDQNQSKTLTFKQSSPCLALTVNCLNVKPTDQLTNIQGVVYDLVYIIQLDLTSSSIINVYLRQDAEFLKVDGIDTSNRLSTINSQGKFLTLWLSNQSTSIKDATQIPTTTSSDNHTYLSPPHSASSSSQIISNSQIINDTSIPYQNTNTISFDDTSMPSNSADEEFAEFFKAFPEPSLLAVSEDISPLITTTNNDSASVSEDISNSTTTTNNDNASVSEDISNSTTTTNNDSVSDLYLTLLHSTHKESSPMKSRAEHDRTVNALASDIFWPLIMEQTKRRSEKKTSSSASSTATTKSIASNSSTTSSTLRRKQLPSITRSQRSHPYRTS